MGISVLIPRNAVHIVLRDRYLLDILTFMIGVCFFPIDGGIGRTMFQEGRCGFEEAEKQFLITKDVPILVRNSFSYIV